MSLFSVIYVFLLLIKRNKLYMCVYVLHQGGLKSATSLTSDTFSSI